MVRSGRTVMPGVSMSTKKAVIASWFGVPGVPVRVSRMHRVAILREAGPHLLAVDDPRRRRAGSARVVSDARSLPEPGSEKPWHQVLAPGQQQRHHLRGELGRRVVDHRRGRAPRASSTARARRARGRRPPRRRSARRIIGSAEPAGRFGPAPPHPAGVVERAAAPGRAARVCVERVVAGRWRQVVARRARPAARDRNSRRRSCDAVIRLRACRSRAAGRGRGRRCAG